MSTSVRDAWTLLGMHTRAAWAIALLFLFSLALLAVTSWQTIQTRWPVVVALLVTAGAVAGLLAVRPDPLPTAATIAIASAGPVSCALVLAVLPVPRTSAAQTWPFAAGTVVATYMCVRGRTPAAWINVLGMMVVALAWSLSTGQGIAPGVAISVFNFGPLAMGTVFAYTLRPAARAIVELREQATERIAEQAATAASLEERDSQLRQLDRLVRPTLDKIARGGPVDASTRLECALLEAELRDGLRAPSLVDVEVSAAARRARARGVEVVMVDDGGADDVTPAVRGRLLRHVGGELDGAEAGSVTVRILPPNRPVLATILVRDPVHGSRRVELDHDGQSISDVNDDASSWVKKL
ncbi:MAG TPA: hypothetical protein VIW24_31385 [Aldersonia sp.]